MEMINKIKEIEKYVCSNFEELDLDDPIEEGYFEEYEDISGACQDEITLFAVELLDSVSLLEEEVRPQKTIPGAEMGIRVSDFLSVLSRTYAGPSEKCRFEADWKLMTDIVTDFGKSAFIVSATQGQVLVEIEAPPAIIFAWALKNAPLVKVVAPAALVKSVREAAANLTRLYGGG